MPFVPRDSLAYTVRNYSSQAMITVTTRTDIPSWQRHLLLILHILVLAGSIALIAFISFDTFRNVSFIENPRYMEMQFWICLLFMLDIIVEFAITPHKWHYIVSHIFFLLIAIPYINILEYWGVKLGGETAYVLRFIPMLRAAYVLAIITGALSSNRISSMFIAYIALLITIVYFSSMMFFVEEHKVNPDVTSYGQALWWSIMCMTTAGCYIGEYTVTGQILSVILSGGGLILFPVFTVYITHAVTGAPDEDTVSKQQASTQPKPTTSSTTSPTAG